MQPILVLTNTTSEPLSQYFAEILDIEGICRRDLIDLANQELTEESLAGRQTVILAQQSLTAQQIQQLADFVDGGGHLIASRPPVDMADVFGLGQTDGSFQEGYLVFNENHPVATNMPTSCLQIHGVADMYRPGEATVLASLAANHDVATIYPAVVSHRFGDGYASAFTFDIATSVARTHQGHERLASNGPTPDPTMDSAYKPDDLFFNYLDRRMKDLPQADLLQDVLTYLITVASPGQVTPRLWHFPHAAAAVAFIDGDSDSMTTEDVETVIAIAESVGGRYTLYVLDDDFPALSLERMTELRNRGHDFGPHPFAGRLPTVTHAEEKIAADIRAFREHYGYRATAHRGHNVIWVGWTEHAKLLAADGIRLDGNFCPGRGLQSGYVNGSALPVKFIDSDGEIIDIYEQSTVSCDDGSFTEKCLLPKQSLGEAIAMSRRHAAACTRHHGVFHPYFHPIYMRPGPMTTREWLHAAYEAAAELGMPFVNGDEWIRFNDARRAVEIEEWHWNATSGELSFCISSPAPIQGLTILLAGIPASPQPQLDGNATLHNVTLEGRHQVALIVDLNPNESKRLKLTLSSDNAED